ncbi:MAG: hypothetical protein U1E45_22575 [Geminicoccaceae bacterium]
MADLSWLFGQAAATITWWQMTARALVVFVYGIAIIRMAGRRAFGRYSTLDIVVGVVIGSNLSRALTANAAFLPTLAATTALVLTYWLSVHAVARSRFLGWLVKGDPERLVTDGRPDRATLRRAALADSDLEQACAKPGCRRSTMSTRRPSSGMARSASFAAGEPSWTPDGE